MHDFQLCSLLILILGFSIVSGKCNKSTAAELEEELKQHYEKPLRNIALYDSGDILKWNCTDNKTQILPQQDKNSTEQTPAESNVNHIILQGSLSDDYIFEEKENSSHLNSYVLIYRNLFKSPPDEIYAPSSNIQVQLSVNETSDYNSTVSHPNATTPASLPLKSDQHGLESNRTTYNENISEDTVSNNVNIDRHNRSLRHFSQNIPVILILGEKHGITFLNVTYPENSILLNKTDIDAFSVDFKFNTGKIFFAGNGTIRSTGQPGLWITAGVEGPVSLAVDWVGDRLYWMSEAHQTVEASGLDGSNRTLLIDSIKGIKYPNNIAVDPLQRVIFFAGNNSVYRSNLKGLTLTKIAPQENETKTVRCLSLDVASKRLYFTGKLENSRKPYIASSDYDGEAVQYYDIGNTDWVDIFSLSVFKDVLYFAHYYPKQMDSIWVFNTSWTGKRPVKVYDAPRSRGGIWSIRVFHSEVQKQSDKLREQKRINPE